MRSEHHEAVFETWRQHLDIEEGFGAHGVSIAECSANDPNGRWVQVVRLYGSTVVVVFPDCPFGEAFLSSSGDLADPEVLRVIAGDPAETLGPAELLFFDPTKAVDAVDGVSVVAATDARIAELVAAADAAEVSESSIEDVHVPLSVATVDGRVVAACGWEVWAPSVAHICVLTDPEHRGRGYARLVALHATRRALDLGLLPQWRSREGNAASAALAKSIGYELHGRQVSFRVS